MSNEIAQNYYYTRVFPIAALHKWLSYNDPNSFAKREFSMSLLKGTEEIYIRWQSFRDSAELKRKLEERAPHKIDIGAIYSCPVSEKENCNASSFRPVSKELVFDVDMNDYDDIRTCCKEKKVCRKCWLFLTIAARVLGDSLKEDFGFQHILWVFSGRRGIHAWICDPQARSLSSQARGALADHMNLVSGGDQMRKKISIYGPKVHPLIRRSYESVKEFFPRLLREQQFFERGSEHVEKAVGYMTDERAATFRVLLEKDWNGSSIHFYELLQQHLQREAPTTLMEIVLAYCYPRLDINVSKDVGHLLKAPFCVHQATGRICVPIIDGDLSRFDPETVPTVVDVKAAHQASCDVSSTPLAPFIVYFAEVFLPKLLQAEVEQSRQGKTVKDEQMTW